MGKNNTPLSCTPRKAMAIHKLCSEGMGFPKISSLYGYSHAWARNVFAKHDPENGLPYVERGKPGPARKISEHLAVTVEMLAKSKHGRSYRSKDIAVVLRDTINVDVSSSTVRRTLKELNIRKTKPVKDVLTQKHKETRVQWCTHVQNMLLRNPHFFNNWIISDEVRVSLDAKGHPEIYIQRGEDKHDGDLQIPSPNSRGSVMYWGAVSRNGPVALVKVTGIVEKMELWGPIKTMDQYKYMDLLTAYLLPYLEQHPGMVFQQDGASIHTSKAMREFFHQYGIAVPK